MSTSTFKSPDTPSLPGVQFSMLNQWRSKVFKISQVFKIRGFIWLQLFTQVEESVFAFCCSIHDWTQVRFLPIFVLNVFLSSSKTNRPMAENVNVSVICNYLQPALVFWKCSNSAFRPKHSRGDAYNSWLSMLLVLSCRFGFSYPICTTTEINVKSHLLLCKDYRAKYNKLISEL